MRPPESPSSAELRRFGLSVAAALLFMAAIHWILLWRRLGVVPPLPAVLPVLALISGVIALLSPLALRPFYVVSEKAMNAVAYLITYMLLTLAFYAVFVPAGLVLRLTAHDLLKRARDSSAPSYWEDAEKHSDSFESYFRQF